MSGDNEMNESILKLLELKNIFSIEKDGDDFILWEGCDHYFHTTLTRNDIRQLIAELHELIKL